LAARDVGELVRGASTTARATCDVTGATRVVGELVGGAMATGSWRGRDERSKVKMGVGRWCWVAALGLQ